MVEEEVVQKSLNVEPLASSAERRANVGTNLRLENLLKALEPIFPKSELDLSKCNTMEHKVRLESKTAP